MQVLRKSFRKVGVPVIDRQADQEVYELLLQLSHFSRVRLFTTPWTAAYQAPPSMGFSRQEYQSGVPLPSPKCMSTHTQIHTTHTQNPTKKPHKTKSAGSKSHTSSMSPPKEEDRPEEKPQGSALDMNDSKQALNVCGKEHPKQRNSQSKGTSLSGVDAFKRRL